MRQGRRQQSASDMAGASRIGRVAAGDTKRRPNLATMMNFDHMSEKDTAEWKKQYGQWRAGHKKRTQDRQAADSDRARRMRRGY